MGKDFLKETKAFNSTFCMHRGLIHILKASEGGVIPAVGYLGYYANLEKLAPRIMISTDFPIFAH